MKNYFADNNYGIRFKSKTEAIEQLCLKVFGAIPVYESSIEDLKEETLESMYAKVVSVALDCDPIPAKDRADGKLEPPWEVFARVKRERDRYKLACDKYSEDEILCKLQEVTEQRDRLAEALQRVRDGYGGQLASPNCCEDCDFLIPIDAALQSLTPNEL
jgi:hypothetical protein